MKDLFFEEFGSREEVSEVLEGFESTDEEEQEEEFTWEDAMDLFFPNAKDEREVEDELEDIWNE